VTESPRDTWHAARPKPNSKSLTGRAGLYEEAHRRIERSWPYGMGFQSGRVDPLDEDNVTMAHAHNMFLESAMGWAWRACWRSAWSSFRRCGPLAGWCFRATVQAARSGAECAAMLMPVAAFCVLDSGFATTVNQVVMLMLVILARAQTPSWTSGRPELPPAAASRSPNDRCLAPNRRIECLMTEVTVLLSVYNGMPYLPEAVESIRRQTLRDWTFVIVQRPVRRMVRPSTWRRLAIRGFASSTVLMPGWGRR